MKERIRSFVGDEISRQIKLGTFHAIAVQYLRQYGQHIGLSKEFGIADSSDSKAILRRIIKRGSFTLEPSKAAARISASKSKGLDHEQLSKTAKHVEQHEFAQIFAEYESELRISNLLDYDDLLLKCCFLLRTHPQCVSNVEAVLIDEFQDTNNIQYDLMSLFAQRLNIITIVGDPDQSIYGWRNAEIKNLTRMKQHWPDTLTINLQENYRSSGAILHAAQNIIEQDETRPPKKLQATHSRGQRPVLRKLPSAAGEASWLVSEIKRMHALSGGVLQHSDFAVLLRTAALSRVIEAALGKAGVPYRMVGGAKFFDRAEVRLVLDYLRVVNQPDHNEALVRIVNVPSRRIGDATVAALQDEASTKGVPIWNVLYNHSRGQQSATTKLTTAANKGVDLFVGVIMGAREKMQNGSGNEASVVDLINFIIRKTDLQTYLKNKFENEGEARWSNVEELIVQATDCSSPEAIQAMAQEQSLPLIDGMDQRASSAEDALSLFLSNLALTASAEAKTEEGAEPIQQVTISTLHSAKGLEWPVVFIPACYEGSIPHSRNEDTDEERRLLYVGMTRAQAMLYLSCPIKNTQREATIMSAYLTQPGVSSFFEGHGPSMSLTLAVGLATTLRRDAPSASGFEEGKSGLESNEDMYWPLNGEEPAEERAKWDYGKADNPLPVFGNARQAQGSITESASFTAGFVSVKDRYDELIEKNRLEAIDKRAELARKAANEAPKGRKRQIEGQGSISTFFAKRHQSSHDEEVPTSMTAQTSFTTATTLAKAPLQEMCNYNNAGRASDGTDPLLMRKIRSAPLRSQISSSFQLPSFDNEFDLKTTSANSRDTEISSTSTEKAAEERFTDGVLNRPATSLHVTSMQTIGHSAQRGRRLGVKPSFNGWANRAHR